MVRGLHGTINHENQTRLSIMRICHYAECENDISHRHLNTKFCSSTCANKDRYAKHGIRMTKERTKELYAIRVSCDKYRRKLNDKANVRSTNIRKYLAEYKISKGCVDCGYSAHHAALDFDHIADDKSFNVCNAKSINAAKDEIKKCEVVCSNCHRIRTYNRLSKDVKQDLPMQA